MYCDAHICLPTCSNDNCKMTCGGQGPASRYCDMNCKGKGCEINCKSPRCMIQCDGGSCRVKVGKNSIGFVSCAGGRCSLICAKTAKKCAYTKITNSCPNCTAPVYVDDPFSISKGNAITVHAAVRWLLLYKILESFL